MGWRLLEYMCPVLGWARGIRHQTFLDEVEGVHRLALLHNHLALGGPGGAQEDCQADELLPAQVSKGGHPMENPQQALQLLKLQGSHLYIIQQLRQGVWSQPRFASSPRLPPRTPALSCYQAAGCACNVADQSVQCC